MAIVAQLELIIAHPEDFKIYKGDVQGADGIPVPKYGLKYGQLFFLKSQVTGQFDGPYRITETTDAKDLKIYLDANMVFIPLAPPNSNIKTLKPQ